MTGFRGVGAVGPGIRRPFGAGHAPPLFLGAVVASALLIGLDVAFAVLLDYRAGQIATVLVCLAADIAAAAACLWTARHAGPGDRRWRVLIGVMAGGMTAGGLLAAVILLTGRPLAGETSSTLALLVFYALALAGLLCLPTDPLADESARRRYIPGRWHAITVLDCVLIVGSVVLLEWITVLGPVVRSSAHDLALFLLALVHNVAMMILATAVLLIASFRRPRSAMTLALLAVGLLTLGLTQNTLVYRVAHGAYELPLWSLVLFAAALLLIFLAALAPVPIQAQPDDLAPPRPRMMWAHAVLPYVVFGLAGLLVLCSLVTGARVDRFEIYGTVSLLVLVLFRQMITLAENTRLLAEIREREHKLHYQAFHDPLTGLANRALFTRRLQRAVTSAANPTGRCDTPADQTVAMAVLFLDLDHFKQVNDAFGHAAGDELLKITARRLRAETRAADTVARLGGDEFAVILDGAAPDDPRRIAERLTTAIQASCQLAGHQYDPCASLGLVTLDATSRPTSPDILLHQADLAMYAAKRQPADRLVVYHPGLLTRFGRDRARGSPVLRTSTPES
ncbi:GGDEF domain-containing protein [Frankia sp. CNm7]|uniref:GGDEF domain-containing protein n=1 Tax=Frankia nepalensis TaxID=1836974 RepID=A0A937UMV1_9ACTN|nr:GGDEF domain-containing protein [Frankia nepalensis]MBL7502748.1 GGDEF domain-containing protein [Frankia nepalensis]MBL7515152.1 GGDEF domain-containing protein [Frankia nepalensis]MBL7518232.1 GGDEF domain-containing protein [Frankia nepalensis]MBL7629219.1 GGDEF domain-containing protein [Frankia nepalensis]